MGFLSKLFNDQQTETTLVANHPCGCGSESFRLLHPYWDVVICQGCGVVYAIDHHIREPIAAFKTQELDTQ